VFGVTYLLSAVLLPDIKPGRRRRWSRIENGFFNTALVSAVADVMPGKIPALFLLDPIQRWELLRFDGCEVSACNVAERGALYGADSKRWVI
jgi:hypothetical protein